MRRIRSPGCCARATSGQTVAVLPSVAKNLRRPIRIAIEERYHALANDEQCFCAAKSSAAHVSVGSKPVSLEVSKCFLVCPRKRTSDLRNEYTPFCNGPGDVKSPRVIVTPPSSRFCPWSAPRPPHYAVRRNGEPI